MDEEKTLFEMHMEDTWETLAKLTGLSNPLFDHTLFLMGYEFTSNSYLLKGDYHSIIDPGNDYSAFMQLLELGIEPPTIQKIALTHGHHDHAMGVLELFRGYGGYGKKDLEIIMHEGGPEEFKRIVRELGCRVTEVKGGEIINLSGFDLELIHTPGHTIDGLCFYHAPTRTVFTGDTVLPLAMAEPDQSGGGRMDHYLYALRTLLKREIDHVLPGHGGVAPTIGKWVVEETYDAPDNACREDSKTPDREGREKDTTYIPQGHHLLQKGPLLDPGHYPVGLSGEPSDGKEFFARMFQNGSIDRDLYILISQGQRKVEEDRHLVEDGEENRKGTTQREMNESEKEDQVALTRYGFHSTPMKIDEKQSSGEIPKWRTVRILPSNL